MGHGAAEMDDRARGQRDRTIRRWQRLGYQYVAVSLMEDFLRCPRCRCLIEEDEFLKHEQWCGVKR